MKKQQILLVFLVFLLILTSFELFYFFYLKNKISKPIHQLTPEERVEVQRVKDITAKAKTETKAREELIKKEALITAKLQPFSQNPKCYLFNLSKASSGIIRQQKNNGFTSIEYEGRLEKAEEFTEDGCNYIRLDLRYINSFELMLPNDFFWETESGKVNALFLKNYLGRKLGIGIDFEQKDNNYFLKKWNFIRFYVE